MFALVVDQVVSRVALDPPAVGAYVVVALATFFAVRRRAAWALVAMIATAPFALYRDVGPTTITLGKIVLIAAIAALISSGVRERLRTRTAGWDVALALLLVVVATCIGFAIADDRGAVARETLKALQYLALFATAFVAWRRDPSDALVRIAILATACVVSIVALAQESTGAPSGLWFDGRAYPRIAGPLEGPNQLAGYLGIVLPFAIAYALRARDMAALVTCAIALAAALLTLSRSGVFADVLGIVVVIALVRGPNVGRVIAACAVGIVAGAATIVGWHASGAQTRFLSLGEVEHSGGVGTRSILYRAALAMWRAHPLLGVGAGNFETQLSRYAPSGIRTHANSWYLQSAAEGGLLALAATLNLARASTLGLWRMVVRAPLVAAAFAASVVFAVHGIFDLLIFFPKVATTWFVVLGIACAHELDDTL